MKTYTNREVEELAQIALDAACFAIQEKLGQEDGGIAGMYFSGVTEDVVMSIFKSYIRTEINFAEHLAVEGK
jgi:hypothetical protein